MQEQLTHSRIFRFWLPLAATWLMMAVEGPFIAAIIARMAAEKLNLAAYGVAYAFGLVAESPVIMLMSASTALCRDCQSYRRLRNFSFALSLSVSLLLALFLLPFIFDPFVQSLLGLPEPVAALTRGALLFLLPWPAAIGIRRFYQGVLIAAEQTRRVALATSIRVLSMAGCALLLYVTQVIDGALSGALALSVGVSAEALLTRVVAGPAISKVLQTAPAAGSSPPGYREIGSYYLPLALTPFIGLSIHPLVTFFLGKSRMALESLAVMPVIYGLTFVFRALGLSYQEVAIALLGEKAGHARQVGRFAVGLGLFSSICLGLIAFTPLSTFWFQDLSGLSPELSDFARLPLQIMAVFPALTVLVCWQRAVLIDARLTRPISLATAVEAVGIFSLLTLAVLYFPLPGAVAASCAYLFGRLLAVAALQQPIRKRYGGMNP